MSVNINATSGSEALQIGGVDAVTFGTNGIKKGLGAAFKGAISGLILSNGTDTDHDIDISVGGARDTQDTYTMNLASVLTKQIDAAWAVGTNAGGLFSGTVTTNTWYHLFLIMKDSDNSIDAGFDTDIDAANIPSGYTSYRRIGSVLTDGSSNILGFLDTEINGTTEREWSVVIVDYSGSTVNATRNLITLSCPPNTIAKVSYYFGGQYLWLKTTSFVDVAASLTTFTIGTANNIVLGDVQTDSSGQAAFRASAIDSLYLNTHGYIDRRL